MNRNHKMTGIPGHEWQEEGNGKNKSRWFSSTDNQTKEFADKKFNPEKVLQKLNNTEQIAIASLNELHKQDHALAKMNQQNQEIKQDLNYSSKLLENISSIFNMSWINGNPKKKKTKTFKINNTSKETTKEITKDTTEETPLYHKYNDSINSIIHDDNNNNNNNIESNKIFSSHQENKERDALDQMSSSVARLKEISSQIGETLDKQNKELDSMNHDIDNLNQNVRKLDKKIRYIL